MPPSRGLSRWPGHGRGAGAVGPSGAAARWGRRARYPVGVWPNTTYLRVRVLRGALSCGVDLLWRWVGLLVVVWLSTPHRNTVPDPACATRPVASPGAVTPAGTVVALVADLRFRGEGAVLAGGPAPRPAPACAPSTPPAGSGTPNASRRPARNSRIPPPPSRRSPGNRRSPSSHPASTKPLSRPCGGRRKTAPPPAGPRPVEPHADPQRHAGLSHVRPQARNRNGDMHRAPER